jgi:hypothetical protein
MVSTSRRLSYLASLLVSRSHQQGDHFIGDSQPMLQHDCWQKPPCTIIPALGFTRLAWRYAQDSGVIAAQTVTISFFDVGADRAGASDPLFRTGFTTCPGVILSGEAAKNPAYARPVASLRETGGRL